MNRNFFKAAVEEFLAASLRYKIIFMWKVLLELYYRCRLLIAVLLWAILIYVYVPKDAVALGIKLPIRFTVSDVIAACGLIATLSALVFASIQLRSWREVKLVEKLEKLYAYSARLELLSNSFEIMGPHRLFGEIREQGFQNEDIERAITLIEAGGFDPVGVIEVCDQIRHELIFTEFFAKGVRFRFRSAKQLKEFFAMTNYYLFSFKLLSEIARNLHSSKHGGMPYVYDGNMVADAISDYDQAYKAFTKKPLRVVGDLIYLSPSKTITMMLISMLESIRFN